MNVSSAQCLNKVLEGRSPRLHNCRQSVINSRLLAYACEDDLNDILAPFHLLHGRNIYTSLKLTDSVICTGLESCKRRLLHVSLKV